MIGYRMVCLDLDGTTLNSAHEVTSLTRATLQKVDQMGIQVALVTGRSLGSTAHYVKELGLSKPTPIVCYNGSFGFMVDEKKSESDREELLFSSTIPPDQTRALLALATKMGLVMQYYNGLTGDVYARPQTEEHHTLLGRYAELTGRKQVLVNSYDECMAQAPSAKLLVLTNDVDALLTAAEAELPPGMFHVIRGSPHAFFAEFLLPDTGNKGSGLKRLCERLGVPVEACVAFGDGENDKVQATLTRNLNRTRSSTTHSCPIILKEFLATAGLGCAMKNARDAAKAAANVVIEWTNDEDGVANHLEAMIAGGLLAST